MELRSPALQVDSLPAEPQGKPKKTGVGGLSLLQGIFPTQGLNQGLLHCRQILHQLNHQGNPILLTSCDAEKIYHTCGHSVTSNSATPWTVARQTPLSMGFSRHEYWSGLPFPPLYDECKVASVCIHACVKMDKQPDVATLKLSHPK